MAPARACLCVLCGLPAAGKSRLARELRGHAHTMGWRTLLVTYDELIPARDWRETEWKQHRKAVLMCLERFLHQTHTHTLSDQTHTLSDQTHTLSDQTHTHTLSDQTHTHTLSESDDGVWMRFQQMLQQQSGSHTHTHSDQTHTHTHSDQTHTHTHSRPLVLLLDDNFYYQSMRHQIHQLARKYAVGFCQVFLSCPLQVCVQRNRRRAQCVCVPEPVLLQVCERMEAPEPDRNQWEQRSLTLDTSDHTSTADLQRLVELLASALENPLKPVQDESQQKEADRRICASSALHQADQTCRRLVSQAVASAREAQASPLQLRALVCELSELKALVLRDLRSGPGALEQQLMGFERRTRQALARHTRPLTSDL